MMALALPAIIVVIVACLVNGEPNDILQNNNQQNIPVFAASQSSFSNDDNPSESKMNETNRENTQQNTPANAAPRSSSGNENNSSVSKTNGTSRDNAQQNTPVTAGSQSFSGNESNSSGSKKTDKNNELLVLVNPWNKLPENYTVTLTQLINGHSVDKRCYPDLQQMMDDCRAAGLQPLICSSYRSQEKQQSLYNNKVDRLVSQGYSKEDARKKAGTEVAVPGTSEHQTGLAVDIVDVNNQRLDDSQKNTAVQKWLMENSWKYGFILRYAADKTSITGIIYEPWHYRYVGKEAAKEMHERGICLEEYLK